MKTVILTAAAAKQFDALPDPIKTQISDDLDLYAMTGRGNVTKLTERPGYRLRSGNYRVIFLDDQITVVAIQIGKRDTQTYK